MGFLIILKVSKGICISVVLVVLGYFRISFFLFSFFFFMNKQSSLRQKEYTRKFIRTKQVAIKLQTPQIVIYHFNGFLGVYFHLDVVEILWSSWFIRHFILFSSFGNILIILYTISDLVSEYISYFYCWLKPRL